MAELALDLDHAAIALLRRLPGEDGWQRLGAAPLDAPDLDARLRALRNEAARASGGGRADEPVGVALVIPDSQILYLDLDLEEEGIEGWDAMAPDGRRAALGRAIEGRTPHAAHELAFDWHGAAPELQVAVVVAQTLREAEAFARAYGFAPMRLTAWPDAETGFPVAPDFGPPGFGPPEAEPATTAGGPAADAPPASSPSASEQGAGRLALAMSRHASEARADRRMAAPPRSAARRAEEADALTVFGARGRPDGAARRPRGRRGLALAGGLAAVLALASTAAVTLWPDGEDADLAAVAPIAPPEAAPAPSASPPPEPRPFGAEPVVVPVPPAGAPARTAEVATPADRPQEDRAATDPDMPRGAELSDLDRARASYAATGIWERAPEPLSAPEAREVAPPPASAGASPDLAVETVRAALAPPAAAVADAPPASMPLPPPPSAAFELGADGRVAATPEGATTPDGVVVHAAAPPRRPPSRPPETLSAARPAAPDAATREQAARAPGPADARPRPRPADGAPPDAAPDAVGDALAEVLVADAASGLGAPAAASLFRAPDTLPAVTAAGTTIIEETTASAFAVAASQRPYARPGDLADSAAEARAVATPPSQAEQAAQAAAATIRTAVAPPPAPPPVAAPAPAPASAAPELPSRASVTRRATVENALSMRRLTLMGVFGAEGARRALLRLPSGRFEKVKVGDRIDGGRVASIGDGRVIYVRGGRNYAIDMPQD